MKKKTLGIILASALLSSIFIIGSPIIYVLHKQKSQNDNFNKPDINPSLPPIQDSTTNPPLEKPDVPPTNNDTNINIINELDKLVKNNEQLTINSSSKLKSLKPSEVNQENISLNDFSEFNFNIHESIEKDKIKFLIVETNDYEGLIKSKIKYDDFISTNIITISGFNKVIDQQSDQVIAQNICDLNKVVDVKNYKYVSKTIPLFYRNEDRLKEFKSDELKKYLKLPVNTNWNKLSFGLYSDNNKQGVLKLYIKYGSVKIVNSPIMFTGFLKANEWLEDIASKNQNLSLKKLNKYKPTEFANLSYNYLSLDSFDNFVDKEFVPDYVHMINDSFQIVPDNNHDDDNGILNAKFKLYLSSDESIESPIPIKISNFERTITIAERFAELNPVIDIKELMKNDDVILYEDNYGNKYNFITYLTRIMPTEYSKVNEKINNAIYEIPWKLKNESIDKKNNFDISNSVIINRKSLNVHEIYDFETNIKFDIIKNTACDRHGTLDIYVKTIYSDNSISKLESEKNKIKITGLLDYSLIGVFFMNYNEKLYISEDSKLYNRDPRDVDLSEIVVARKGARGDFENIWLVEKWMDLITKIKLVPVKGKDGNYMQATNDRLFAQVQIDGIDIINPSPYRYIEVIWRNRS